MCVSGRARLIFTSLCVAGSALFAGAPFATAMEGGARGSSRDTLALATVAVIAETRSAGHIGVDYCSGVLIRPDAVLTAGHCIGRHLQVVAVIPFNGGKPSGSAIPVRAVAKESHVDTGELPSTD